MIQKLHKRVLILIFIITYPYIAFTQLKDIYESVYFNNSSFLNPANIVKEDKYFGEINLLTYSPASNNNNGAYKSFSTILSKSLGKNGSAGLLFDVNSIALFNNPSFAAKYAYLAKFSENLQLSMGFSVGFKNSRIDQTSIISTENTVVDPLVNQYNSKPGELYSDFGVKLQYKKLHIQGAYFDLTRKQDNNKQVDPKLFAGIDYEFNSDLVVIKPFAGFTQYFDGSSKIIGGGQFFFNPIAFSYFYSTLKKHTVSVDLYVSDDFLINIGYVFGPYYNNPVFGQTGNIIAGLKYTIP